MTEQINKPPLPQLDDDHLKMIGLVITTWGNFEGHLVYLLCQFATASKRRNKKAWEASLILVTGMGWNTMLGLIRSLVFGHFPKDVKTFDNLRRRIEDSKKLRDMLAHNFILKGNKPGTISVIRMKSINEFKSVSHQFTQKELSQLAEKIYNEHMELVRFLIAHGVYKPPKKLSKRAQALSSLLR
ncbi:MAG: hypothetical protein WBQ69_02100 [Gallionella sp.]